MHRGYKTLAVDAYPYRAHGAGEEAGLSFEMWREIDEIKNSGCRVKGFKLAFHLPCEISQFNKNYFRFPLQKSINVIIRPSLLKTENLGSHSSRVRQCFMDGEKKLMIFKTYTKNNCEMECLVNYTRESCDCVPSSLPRLFSDKICNNLEKKTCFANAKKDLMTEKILGSLEPLRLNPGETTCDCLSECTSIHYDGEISQDDIRFFGTIDAFNRSK